MTDFGPRAPHGPDMTGTHDPLDSIDAMHLHEREAFDSLIHPDDSYTPEGTYWADLPWKKKFSFVTSYDAQETKREFNSFWKMFKQDPLEPVRFYLGNMVLPGAGLGLEGYVCSLHSSHIAHRPSPTPSLCLVLFLFLPPCLQSGKS